MFFFFPDDQSTGSITDPVPNELNDIILYQGSDGNVKVEILFEDETFWLNQKRLSELFGKDIRTISEHLNNIYSEGELTKEATIRKFRIVQKEGHRDVTREVDFYNLDAVIAVGYRVNSREATQFRIWATQVLKEFIIKGFVLDDERLKQGKKFGKDYFDELLERIREIRASERRFYEKITDIYAQCSIDYVSNSEITIRFYQTVQNKLHWAITGKTAPEIIADRADSNKEHMGLQTWKNAPDGKILQSDTLVAKNYLQQPEIKELERIVSMYLDYAENQAARQIPMKMQDWIQKLDAFLQFNEYEVLQNAGKITRQLADESAKMEYQKFRVIQDRSYLSDFDKEVKKITQKNKKK
ncbi:virulence RhuM family protein [Pelosinus fermentans]|uniref:Virulence protein RhuM n=1 Tax=Pelosinus fermentans JBW45 TaxID=1192197 RepID=I8U1Q3_9FIRM|nr:virulence RhuM family protein [Pelosinus fermentans]AJQ30040.1 virulence protein RhuM [Pelosinus fermentans JBW45]